MFYFFLPRQFKFSLNRNLSSFLWISNNLKSKNAKSYDNSEPVKDVFLRPFLTCPSVIINGHYDDPETFLPDLLDGASCRQLRHAGGRNVRSLARPNEWGFDLRLARACQIDNNHDRTNASGWNDLTVTRIIGFSTLSISNTVCNNKNELFGLEQELCVWRQAWTLAKYRRKMNWKGK